MNTRKIFSVLVIATTLISINQSFATVGMGNSVSGAYRNYSPPVKIGRLMRVEPLLVKYITKEVTPKILAIKYPQVRKGYLFDLAIEKDKLEDVFSSMKYARSDTQYDNYLKRVRTSALAIRDIGREIQKVTANNLTPFIIPEAEVAAVEADVLTTQKDLVGYLKTVLQMYDGQDIKQSNPSAFHFESEMGTVDVNLEKNTSIFSWITGNSETDLKLTATADLKLPGGYVFDANGKYTQSASRSFKGDIKFDGNMKTIDNEMYFTLRDYSINVSSELRDMSTKLKETKALLDTVKGKTIRIPLPEDYMDTKKILTTIKSVLDVLETKPFLTPYKAWEGRYALEPKKSTLDAIGTIFNEPLSADDFNIMRKASHYYPIWYSEKNGGHEFAMYFNENGTVGTLKLLNVNDTYTFTTNITSGKSKIIGEIRDGYIKYDVTDASGEAHLLWANKNLSLEASGMGQIFSIIGPLSVENTDLKINFNGKEIGTIKATGTTTHSEYEINLGFDLPSPWKFSAKGTMDIERGTFTIEKPANAVDVTSLMSETESGILDELDL